MKNVIVNLARNIESGRSIHEWENVPIEQYLQKDEEAKAVSVLKANRRRFPGTDDASLDPNIAQAKVLFAF